MKRSLTLAIILPLCLSSVYGQTVQWASSVIEFSSELTPVQYSAQQVLGKPNVLPAAGQNPSAWTPEKPKRQEFIKVGYSTPMQIRQVAIAESYNPSGLFKVFVYDEAGTEHLLHSLNPERVLVAMEAIGIGQDALRRAAKYARERVVFDRAIGQNQGIQHPLAQCWMYLESAYLMAERAATLYDSGKPCGAEANAAKFLGARAGHDACLQAVLTHGGFGYAKEYHVERLLREEIVTRIAPITEQLILSYVAEKVLDLPKSY